MEIKIENKIREICPEMQIGIIRCKVVNSETNDSLWNKLNIAGKEIVDKYALLQLNQRPAIAATRHLYKTLGKDPNRYRVSSEALCRRIIKGLGIYRINTIVDLINLVSIKSGYAIGCFDADKITGGSLALGIGMDSEKFEGIGRGYLNVKGLPIYRDSLGGIGTPTSDEERTKIEINTKHIHININAFSQEMPLLDTINWTVNLLSEYAFASDIYIGIIK